ncbi:MAG: response regulator [Spirochaetes bacterium]|nr:response regulator [Spirochaetota bacterium]
MKSTSRRVLIVDDSSTLRASVEFSLSEAGYEVLHAPNGVKALEILDKHSKGNRQIGMIITDINMPAMDGITFIKEVKKTTFKFTPILVMTTESEENKKLEGKAAGASGWLVKPFKPEQLIRVVSRFIRS